MKSSNLNRVCTYVRIITMPKVSKTIKISMRHEAWLKTNRINFSAWIREQLDTEMDQLSSELIGHAYKAIILAAGKDTGLFPLTEDRPKTMLDIKGCTILERQIELLRRVGINDIAVVRGYQKHMIDIPNLTYFDNDDFENTGSLSSLFLAREFMDRDSVVLYGDILFRTEILRRLIENRDKTTLVVDRGWKKRYRDSMEKHPLPPELAILHEKDSKIAVDSLTVSMSEDNFTSEFIGLAMLSTHACAILRDFYKKVYCSDRPEVAGESMHVQKASFIVFIQELLNKGEDVAALEIWRNWIDVDTFEDYRNAWTHIDEITDK